MVRNGLVNGVKIKKAEKFICKPCQYGKSHRLPFKERPDKRNTKPGECVHTDVCGEIEVESLGGADYYVTFIDDALGFCYVYFLKHKDKVLEKFKLYENMIANKFGQKIKIVRSDNGRKYKNAKMNEYIEERGIIMENTAPHTPQQNRKAERAYRTIMECARTIMRAKSLPKNLWAETVSTAVYVLNRTTHSSRKRESSNYRLYDPVSKKVSVSRDVVFDETLSTKSANEASPDDRVLVLRKTEAEREADEVIEINDDDEEADLEDIEPAFQRRREDERDEQHVAADKQRQLRDRTSLRVPQRYNVDFAEYKVPVTYREAINGPNGKEWAAAIERELQAHNKNETWTLVKKKDEMKIIDSKWVFKLLPISSEDKHRFKARLCARGFLQRQGIDYNETFDPVVRYDILRMFLARVTQEDLELTQFDVCTAFLYGELEEEIFMKIPEGLVVPEKKRRNSDSVVCRLNKSLYGLKRAPRC